MSERRNGKTLRLLTEAAATPNGALFVVHRPAFADYCRALAQANGLDISRVRFVDARSRTAFLGQRLLVVVDHSVWELVPSWEREDLRRLAEEGRKRSDG